MKLFIPFFLFLLPALLFSENLLSPGNLSPSSQTIYAILVKDYASSNSVLYDPGNLFSSKIYPGSLMKLIALSAKYQGQDFNGDPVFTCSGYGPGIPDSRRCWLKSGHGSIGLTQAVAYSCNSYFYQFFQETDYQAFLQFLTGERLLDSLENIGRTAQNADERIESLIGRRDYIGIAPEKLLDFYHRFVCRDLSLDNRLSDAVIEGLNGSYAYGTSSDARKKLRLAPDLPFLCKTGTGPFIQNGEIDRRKTHGYFIGFYNRDLAVLVMAPDSRGAEKAAFIGLNYIKLQKKL